MSPLVALILLAAVLVIITIIVSLATAYDLGRQRATLKALDQVLLEIDGRAEKAADQRQKVQGSLELHQRQRDEKVEAVRSLLERLRQLEAGEDEDREIGVSAGLRQRTMDDALGDE